MKNKFLACFTGALLTWTITGIAYTQSLTGLANNKHQTPLEYYIPVPEQLSPANCPGFFYRNDINIKAVRNFIKAYKNAADAKWFKSNNGFVVHCTMYGLNTKVYYDKKGNCECIIRSYTEDRLPREVRHLVKSNFYDFSFNRVTEISRNGKITYVVKLEDKTCWKTIKVVDSELEVVAEFSKS